MRPSPALEKQFPKIIFAYSKNGWTDENLAKGYDMVVLALSVVYSYGTLAVAIELIMSRKSCTNEN